MRNCKENPTKKRRKRRKASRERVSFQVKRNQMLFVFVAVVLSLATFANQICDIQSTPIQADIEPTLPSDANQGTLKQGRILVEPQDTVVLLGQAADLTCLVEGNLLGQPSEWLRNEMAVAYGPIVVPPFHNRFSLPGLDKNASTAPANSFNYTLHVSRTSLADDQSTFTCQTSNRSREATLTVWQPPTQVSVVAKIDDSSATSSEPHQQPDGAHLLLASVASEKTESDSDEQQITRILVRQNTRLRLECRSDASKPEPKLVWFDHLHQPVVQDTFNLTTASSSSSGEADSSNENNGISSDSQPTRRKLAQADTLVWSFVVQKQHNDHVYTCQADHPAFGDARRFPHLLNRQPRQRIRLEVQYEPEIRLTKDQAQLYENKPVRFHCEARARPNLLTYRWYIDGRPVPNASEPELQIARLTRQMNQREIRCQVSNEVGSDSAVMRLSVNYAPAFVTHLLPTSLQPQIHQIPHRHGATAAAAAESSAMRRHDLVLARQLAVGVDQGQDVELRCDFDAHPRVNSIHWYKLPTEFSIMGNVTQAESEDLIQHGVLYATFKYAQPDFSSSSSSSSSSITDQLQEEMLLPEIDYEQMSADELAAIAADLSAASSANGTTGQPLLESIPSQAPTLTNALIYEPLDWSVGQETAATQSAAEQMHHRPIPSLAQRSREEETITTVHLHSRSFSSDEIDSRPSTRATTAADKPLNWRTAEVMSSKLVLRQVNVDSVGKYVCRAKLEATELRPAHQVARALYLVLRDKPRIISHAQQFGQLQAKQETLQVECLAQINTIVDNSTQIQWFREGKLVEETNERGNMVDSEGKNISIIVERSPDLLFIRSRLRIKAPTYGDFGIYNCTLSNAQGRADSMAINFQPEDTTGLLFRAIAAMGILSIFVLGSTITCLLAFAPQRRKQLASSKLDVVDAVGGNKPTHQHHHDRLSASKVKPRIGGASDQLNGGPTTATTASSSSTHGSDGDDSDSLRKSQVSSSDQPATLSEAPTIDDPSAHLYSSGGGSGGAHQQHYISQNHLNHYNPQQQQIYNTSGWQNGAGHYQMPVAASVQAPALPPPLPPPPPQVSAMIVESPYVSNGRTYYHSSPHAGNGVLTGSGHYATTVHQQQQQPPPPQPNHVMLATDGEAQFESQYGSMISNAYRALGYSSTSSPSSGGSSSSASAIPTMSNGSGALVTIGGLHQHHSGSGSNSSGSPNSMTTYHNLQSGGYISTLSLQRQQAMQAQSGSADIQLLMKTTSDNNNKHHHTILETTTTTEQKNNNNNYLTTASVDISNNNPNTTTNNNNGLATHV